MALNGFLVIVVAIAIGVFAFGCWMGARSFETRTSKIVAGILCGLGAVAIAGGIAFGGCMLILSQVNFH